MLAELRGASPGELAAAADLEQHDLVTGFALRIELARNLIGRSHLLLRHFRDDVAGPDVLLSGRAVGIDFGDQHALHLGIEAEAPPRLRRHRRQRHAEIDGDRRFRSAGLCRRLVDARNLLVFHKALDGDGH